jgi:hypothetical protein
VDFVASVAFGTSVAFVAFVASVINPLDYYLASYPYFVIVVVVDFDLFISQSITYIFLHLQELFKVFA